MIRAFCENAAARAEGTVRGVRRILLLAVLAIALAVSCQTPFSAGLEGNLTGSGTSGETSVTITEVPERLTLEGRYDVRSGSLSVQVTAPDGGTPLQVTYTTGQSGTVEETLTPAAGEWILEVTSPGAVGSYEFHLIY